MFHRSDFFADIVGIEGGREKISTKVDGILQGPLPTEARKFCYRKTGSKERIPFGKSLFQGFWELAFMAGLFGFRVKHGPVVKIVVLDL